MRIVITQSSQDQDHTHQSLTWLKDLNLWWELRITGQTNLSIWVQDLVNTTLKLYVQTSATRWDSRSVLNLLGIQSHQTKWGNQAQATTSQLSLLREKLKWQSSGKKRDNSRRQSHNPALTPQDLETTSQYTTSLIKNLLNLVSEVKVGVKSAWNREKRTLFQDLETTTQEHWLAQAIQRQYQNDIMISLTLGAKIGTQGQALMNLNLLSLRRKDLKLELVLLRKETIWREVHYTSQVQMLITLYIIKLELQEQRGGKILDYF